MPTQGSLVAFMTALTGLETGISPDLRVYRWRPVLMPEVPAVYHWLSTSPADIPATHSARDTLNLAVRIAVRHTDSDEEMAKVEAYYDQARDVLDHDFSTPSTSVLRPACLWAKRTTSRTALDTFNDVDVLILELGIQAELRRTI